MLDSNITKSYFCTKLIKLCFVANLTKILRLHKQDDRRRNKRTQRQAPGIPPEC